VDEPGEDRGGGKHLRRDRRLAEKRAVRAKRLRGVLQRAGDERPREDAAEEEQRVRAHVGARREHEAEHGGVDEQQQQGLISAHRKPSAPPR
jgi:hypothetical protein